MNAPGAPSTLFLLYVLALLPWVAFRSARRLRLLESSGQPFPSRQKIWTGTLVSLLLLFLLAWVVGRGFGFDIFAMPRPMRLLEYIETVGALNLLLLLRRVSHAMRSPEERRRMTIYRLAPRGGNEWAVWIATVLVASVAEEAAYRGVAMQILWYTLGNPWLAAAICAIAFALAHATQGWKSMLVIFAIALIMHGLVALTETLVLAMIVHSVYDLVAGYRISQRARMYDQQAAEPRPA